MTRRFRPVLACLLTAALWLPVRAEEPVGESGPEVVAAAAVGGLPL